MEAIYYVGGIQNSTLNVMIKWRMLFERGVIRHFLPSCLDNSPFPLRVAGGGGGGMGGGTIHKNGNVSPFKAMECFPSERKKTKGKPQQKQLNFSYFPWTGLSVPLQLLWQQQLSSFFIWIYFQTENNDCKKIRKWGKHVGIQGIRIIYPREKNAKRWWLYGSGLLKVTMA